MKLFTRLVILCITSALIIPQAKAQSLETLIDRYAGEDAEGYIQPFSDALGANMNSGWYHSSFIRKKGFQLYFGIVTQSALIADKKTTYKATLPDTFTPQDGSITQVTVPTIMGDTENVVVPGVNGTQFIFPAGLGVSMVPLAVPQLTVGSLYGTDVSVRFAPIDVRDFGEVSLFGWGVRHSISQYLTNFPVELAVGYYSTNFEITEEEDEGSLESSHSLISVQASYFVGKSNMLELYGGLGYETGSFTFEYEDSEDPGTRIEVDPDPGNSVRFTVGATLNLGVFTMNLDYNLADQQALSAAIGVGFGKKKKTE